MTNVKFPSKKINPFFQTRYVTIRNENDIQDFLCDSEMDIINRVGQFIKKVDTKNFNNKQSKEKKKKNVYDSDPEDDDDEGGGGLQLDKSYFKLDDVRTLDEIVITGEIAEYAGDVPSDIPDTIYVSSGCQNEQINVMPMQTVFANGYIDLPPKIIHTQSCVNIKNEDDRCVIYCHLLHERYSMTNNKKIEHPERLYGKKVFIYNNEMINLHYDDITFPIPYNNFYVIKKIEDQNKIKIHIFEYKKDKVLPIYHSKKHLKIQ